MGFTFSGKRTFDARTLLRNLAIGEADRKVTTKDEQGIPGNELDIFTPRDEKGLSRSFYLYHGNPIAMYDPYIERYFVSTFGWKDSVTTRAKIQSVLGKQYLAYKRDRKTHDITLSVGGEPLEDSKILFTHLLGADGVHVMDAWRAWKVPFTAVAGSNDTGTWSDSPCPSHSVNSELESIMSFLKKHGMRPYACYAQTSNVFCIARYVCVPLHSVLEARNILSEHEVNFREKYLYAYRITSAQAGDALAPVEGGYL